MWSVTSKLSVNMSIFTEVINNLFWKLFFDRFLRKVDRIWNNNIFKKLKSVNKFSSTNIRWFRNLRWHTHDTSANQKLLFSREDKSTCLSMTLTTSLVIQIYDLEHDSRCERHTVFALKCFRRHMLLEICSKCEILLKCCPKCEKVLKGAQNAK